jgi:hypothetical protein
LAQGAVGLGSRYMVAIFGIVLEHCFEMTLGRKTKPINHVVEYSNVSSPFRAIQQIGPSSVWSRHGLVKHVQQGVTSFQPLSSKIGVCGTKLFYPCSHLTIRVRPKVYHETGGNKWFKVATFSFAILWI